MTNTGNRPDQVTLEQKASALAARALEAVHRSNLGLRMKRALELVAVGDLTYRKVADAVGYRSAGTIYRYARAYGIGTVHHLRYLQRPDVRHQEELAAERAKLQQLDEELWQDFVARDDDDEDACRAQKRRSERHAHYLSTSDFDHREGCGARRAMSRL